MLRPSRRNQRLPRLRRRLTGRPTDGDPPPRKPKEWIPPPLRQFALVPPCHDLTECVEWRRPSFPARRRLCGHGEERQASRGWACRYINRRSPQDVQPRREAIQALVDGRARVALFTAPAPVKHLLRVAAEDGVKDRLLGGLEKVGVASVGPTCSQTLLAHGIRIDVEPGHPQMGPLVQETA